MKPQNAREEKGVYKKVPLKREKLGREAYEVSKEESNRLDEVEGGGGLEHFKGEGDLNVGNHRHRSLTKIRRKFQKKC